MSADEQHPGDRTDILRRLEAQNRAGFLKLRFEPDLEPPFLADHAQSIARQRLWLMAAAIVLIGTTPLADAWYLHPPEPMIAPLRWVQFGLMVPSLLVAAVATIVPSLQRWADPLGLMAAFVVAAGVIFQRALGAHYGFVVPAELVGVVLAGTAILAGFRFAHFAPLAAAILAAFLMAEFSFVGTGSQNYYVALSLGMLALIAVLGTYLQEHAARGAWLQRKALEELAVHDPLTGYLNARGFKAALPAVYGAAVRDHKSLLIAAIDIDHFKAFNDYYGHLAGDACLQRVADRLAEHARRSTDLRARTGGEEFVLVCYDVSILEAEQLLETLRAGVQDLGIPHAASAQKSQVVTISIGAVCVVPESRSNAEFLLQCADDQLYISKQEGRNRVSLQTVLEPPEIAHVRHRTIAEAH